MEHSSAQVLQVSLGQVSILLWETVPGAVLDVHWLPIWDWCSVSNQGSESLPMVDNASPAATALLIAKWALMFGGTRNGVKTLYALLVLDVVCVHLFVPGVY